MPGLKRATRGIRRYLTGVAVIGTVRFVNGVSAKMAKRIADCLGAGMYLFSRTDRKRILQNLESVYGTDMSQNQKRSLAKQVCKNLAWSAVEAMRIRNLEPEAIRDSIDDNDFQKVVDSAFSKKKSLMLITGHYGNWELFAARVAQMGPLTVLARKNVNERIEKIISDVRERNHVRVMDRSDPAVPREMIRLGREGGHMLGILMDQDTARIQGIFSPFLGKVALTPSGPASIAIRKLYEVYVVVLRPDKELGKHTLVVEGPIEIPEKGDRNENIQALTNTFNSILSKIIREGPEHWVWNHRRWRHRPEEFDVEGRQ